jgi:2-polyprenyl-6-methoxyphenol hydroxylase-like FAD-dependent oxidoreductase
VTGPRLRTIDILIIGAGIQLSANAVKVLDHLGLRGQIEAPAVRTQSFDFRRFDGGEVLHRIPLGELHEKNHGAPYFQIHRADLHRALQGAVRTLDPQAVTLEARASAIEEGSDAVTVHFDHLPPTQAELVIGADGIKSVVRRHIVGADASRFTGQVAWRCAVPIERIPPALRAHLCLERCTQHHAGRRRAFHAAVYGAGGGVGHRGRCGAVARGRSNRTAAAAPAAAVQATSRAAHGPRGRRKQ